jgi:mono/diheme cytochrome c family protein
MKQFTLAPVAALALGLMGCGKHKDPNFIYMPDMAYQPSYKAQEEYPPRMPVKGTIHRNFVKDEVPETLEEAGKSLRNPRPKNRQVLQEGQKYYNVYCAVCHGTYGEGNGSIVPKYPQPPSLQSDKIRGYPDGSIYHVITKGQNLMPSYAQQVDPQTRWAIIHYIRALQKAKSPTNEEMKAAEGF